MSDTAEAVVFAFSAEQRAIFLAWSAKCPRGFRVMLATANDTAEELAMVTQRAAHEYLYCLHPLPNGRINVGIVVGHAEWECDTVEEALAELLAIEEEREARWIADAR
jgi:hypothetical protein